MDSNAATENKKFANKKKKRLPLILMEYNSNILIGIILSLY